MKKSPIQPNDLNPFFDGDIKDFKKKLKAKKMVIAANVHGWWDIVLDGRFTRDELLDLADFLARKAHNL